MRRPELERHLVLVAEVERLDVAPAAQVPDVEAMAVLLAEQQLRDHAALDHLRRAPLARQQGVVAEVPPEVVGEVLRPAIALPAAAAVEALAVGEEEIGRAACGE